MDEEQQYRLRLADGREFGPAPGATIVQWAREGRVPQDSTLVTDDGRTLAVREDADLAAIVQAPPTVYQPDLSTPATTTPGLGGGLSGMIPYRNGPALIGYYCGFVALFPGLGLLVGPVAVVLGIIGLRRAGRDPASKGVVHAWVGIALGILGLLISLVVLPVVIWASTDW